MSIYATLGRIGIEKFSHGDDFHSVWIQGVPSHIGSPTEGYEDGDPFAAFLPPPVQTDENGDAPHMRAVVFVGDDAVKGTARAGQEYADPLLVLTGEEYARIPFDDLVQRLAEAVRSRETPAIRLHAEHS